MEVHPRDRLKGEGFAPARLFVSRQSAKFDVGVSREMYLDDQLEI